MTSNFSYFFVLNISKNKFLLFNTTFYSFLFRSCPPLGIFFLLSNVRKSLRFSLFFTYKHEKQMIYVKELL